MFEFLRFIAEQIFMLSHISSGSFPKPLAEKQEAELIEKFEKGDIEAKNQLIEHNLRLVAHIVKKYAVTPAENDDLLSIGTIGLIKGISTFTTEKNTKLSTYVARCIHNEILMVMRARKHGISEISLQEAIGCDKEGNEVTLMDIIPSDEDEIALSYENRIQVKKMFDSIKTVLTKRERTILELRYGFNDGVELTQREIAKMLGISRSYVSRIEKKAVGKIKANMSLDK
ncbi:MAG: RNA polymerase sporulation sigma factor SigK [Bacillota bacterium]|nr:RNA polymerase sporulation sigma factor SigK [Bacillota bacterium]